MDINRNALLLYLRDLRDLEIAKKKISALYSKEKKYMENELVYMKTPSLRVENDVPDYSGGFMMLGIGIVGTLFSGWITLGFGTGFFTIIFKLFFGGMTIMCIIMTILGLVMIISDDREVSKSNKEAKLAKLDYKVLSYNKQENLSLVEVNLHTGRHHQIRVQLANIGHSLYGDQKYEKTLKEIEERYNINRKIKPKNIEKDIIDKVAKTHFKNIKPYT